jgi:hypothetical protein
VFRVGKRVADPTEDSLIDPSTSSAYFKTTADFGRDDRAGGHNGTGVVRRS